MIQTKSMTLTPGTWYKTKLELDGDGSILRAYIDGDIILEAELTSGAYTKGTVGF